MASEEFVDGDTGDQAACLVRVTADGLVGLALTFRSDGELEVFVEPDVAERIAVHLTAAASDARAADESA